ncbi:MAG: ATP-binding protein, partial [Gemmatimonadota bacterium]
RLEQVIHSSTAVIYATRVESKRYVPSWVSENLHRITGYDTDEALDPSWWYDRVHPEDQERVVSELSALTTVGQITIEYRFKFASGEYRWLRDEARLMRDAEGRPHEVFGAWLDITDLKLAEASLREGRDMAERSARSRSEFLANMSHEIRTPMNAVLGLTELVLDTDLNPEQRRSLRLVQSAGETLLTLLNDILDLSKIEAEHLALEAIPFDPRYLLESTVGLLAVRVGDRPIELLSDVASSVPSMVVGDPTRLRQVLSNLVGNGLKFTERGEVVVSVTRKSTGGDECRLQFTVRDTGIGIAPDKLATIFDKFTQADASMTRKYGGTGLGLAISRRLVGLMGGELSVTSQPGRGSEFSFAIPAPVDSRGTVVPSSAALNGQHILVVDDNETNRRIVREVLTVAGATVDEADSAAAGLIALQHAAGAGRPCGLAIIDSQMPDRDGFALAADIRADASLASSVRLLMLTSAGQRGDTQRCRDVGIEAYLMKPLSRSDLLEATGVVLGISGKVPAGGLITRHTIAESRPRLRLLLAEDNPVNQEVAAT